MVQGLDDFEVERVPEDCVWNVWRIVEKGLHRSLVSLVCGKRQREGEEDGGTLSGYELLILEREGMILPGRGPGPVM